MREIWRPVVGYEGLYEVSNMGNIKSLGNGKSNNSKERIMKPFDNGNGYLHVHLCKDGKDKNYKIHRLVAQAFIQFVPQEGVMYDVDHRNTDRTDNRAINLILPFIRLNQVLGRSPQVGGEVNQPVPRL